MRKAIYVSGTRADYGLMSSTLKRMHESVELELGVCVTGMHLLARFGNTVEEIERDGLTICGRIQVQLDAVSGYSMARAMAQQLSEMLDVFSEAKPDMVIVLGDRGEMLAAALAAIHLNIAVVHIHGGERSGSIDEPVRHAISKLAHYHFTATEQARQRLIRMGELPEHVFVTGAPGLDGIRELVTMDRQELCASVNFKQDIPVALLVFHPVVQEQSEAEQHAAILLSAINALAIQTVCLMPNSDAGGCDIGNALKAFSENPGFRLFTHLPRSEFIAWMNASDVMIGNSSSGIIEAASFNLPVINIGKRQEGRERSGNVQDVDTDKLHIIASVKKALADGKVRQNNVYGDGLAGERILELLTTLPVNRQILNKINAY